MVESAANEKAVVVLRSRKTFAGAPLPYFLFLPPLTRL
jgi:hypothetical protein